MVRGEELRFLTSEYTLPPGIIAHRYRLRWEIEKTFDELKNKLGETKAWASSAKAQALQAHFLCLAHNLMILCEAELARVHGGRNAAELTWRAPRLEPEEKRLAKENLVRPRLVRTLQRCTGRSVKFIRWLPVPLFLQPHHEPASAALRQSYAVLQGDFWTPLGKKISDSTAFFIAFHSNSCRKSHPSIPNHHEKSHPSSSSNRGNHPLNRVRGLRPGIFPGSGHLALVGRNGADLSVGVHL